MKKVYTDAITSFLRTLPADAMLTDAISASEVLDAIDTETAKDAAKRQENRELYSEAHDTVISHLHGVAQPMTIAEIWEECKGNLPDFTKGKLTYAITRMWASEFTRTEGKVNTYTLRS